MSPGLPDGSSFIGDLLRRHPAASGNWPGENLLTNATAAVLRRVPSLAAAVTGAMLESVLGDERPPCEVDVSTQHYVSGVGTPDLVLDGSPDYLVWIEVQDWDGESAGQLRRYWEALQSQPARYKRLVYLTRTGGAPPSISDAHPQRWVDLAQTVVEWRKRDGDRVAPEQRWLVDDYLRYLTERGLAMTEPLPAEFADSLRDFAPVVEKLGVLQGMVNDQVQDEGWVNSWGAFDDWNDWWCAYYPEPADAYLGSAFDWGMLKLLTGRPPVFMASLWFGDPWPAAKRRSWIDHMLTLATDDGHSFEDPSLHAGERLCRTIPFRELRSGQLTDQAGAMAEFAIETFGLLKSNPPEPA